MASPPENAAEQAIRTVLHNALPAQLAILALVLDDAPPEAAVDMPHPALDSVIHIAIGDLRPLIRSELDRRFSKSAEGRGGGT